MKYSVRTSDLRGLYTTELFWLGYRIQQSCEQLFGRFDSSRPFMSSDLDALGEISTILSEAAKLADFLDPRSKDRIYMERALYLGELLPNLELKELLAKRTRNAIEHFAEHLDKRNRQLTALPKDARYAVGFNLIFDDLYLDEPREGMPSPLLRTRVFDTPLYPVRLYAARPQIFYIFDRVADIGAIYREVRLLVTTLRPKLESKAPEEWPSMIIGKQSKR